MKPIVLDSDEQLRSFRIVGVVVGLMRWFV
jgi:hypothetical protein